MKTNAALVWSTILPCFVMSCISSCSDVPFLVGDKCGDPTSPWAEEYRCAASDAGTDANSEGGSGGSGGEAAGLNPSSVFRPDACQTECVPEAEGPDAAGWSLIPGVAWFGSISELDAHKCPDGESYEKAVRYDKLVANPAKCDACACLPDGSCTDLPETIEIRSGKCGVSNVLSTPFGGPPNWDGSCTSANAMPAGKLCNGVPCAQSVSTSTLPGPVNESCTPTVEKPAATIDKHEWLEGVRICGAKDLAGKCGVTPEHCQNLLDDGWLRCVMREGKHNECPGNFNEYPPRFVYQDNPIDDRGCSSCECGAPKDGLCLASLRLHSDASCANEINKYQLASTGPLCADLQPPGLALGSKTITNLSYVPGTCSVTGGEPIGTAIPNDKDVTTICCRAPGPAPLPELQ